MSADAPPPIGPVYNGITMQKLRILARLTQAPATCEQLQAECQSPDPRARIHELRNEGHTITTHRLHRVNNDGTINAVGLYRLTVQDVRQAGLFEFS
jgi:hypothetical protein